MHLDAEERAPLTALNTSAATTSNEGSADSEQMAGGSASGSSSGRAALLAGGLVVAGGGLFLLSRSGVSLNQLVQDLEALIAGSGPLGPLIFVAAYVAATVLLFPASLLTLGAGYLFGEGLQGRLPGWPVRASDPPGLASPGGGKAVLPPCLHG